MTSIDHFVLTPDASRIIDKRTGASWTTREAMQVLFAKEPPMRPNRYPRHAYDQMFAQTSEAPEYNQGNGDQEGGSPIDADQCMTFLQALLAKLPPEEHEKLIAQMAQLIQSAHGMGAGDQGLPQNNLGALDRGRRFGGGGRRPAQDSAFAVRGTNTANFLKKWPDAAKVSLSGTGR
jgi:hypothetical protein